MPVTKSSERDKTVNCSYVVVDVIHLAFLQIIVVVSLIFIIYTQFSRRDLLRLKSRKSSAGLPQIHLNHSDLRSLKSSIPENMHKIIPINICPYFNSPIRSVSSTRTIKTRTPSYTSLDLLSYHG